jgi:hypothetical protein
MQLVVLSVLDFDFSIAVRPLRGASNRNTSGSAGGYLLTGFRYDFVHGEFQPRSGSEGIVGVEHVPLHETRGERFGLEIVAWHGYLLFPA